MRDEGYTLVEVLVALMIIGLSLTAMAAAVAAASQLQRRGAAQAQAMERTQALANDLDALMASEGPFSSAGGAALQGQTTTFQFDCGTPEPCGASIQPTGDYAALTVKGRSGAHTTVWRGETPLLFTYIGTRTLSDQGEQPAHLFSPNVGVPINAGANAATVEFDQRGSNTMLILMGAGGGGLSFRSFTLFTDGSARNDYDNAGRFNRQ